MTAKADDLYDDLASWRVRIYEQWIADCSVVWSINDPRHMGPNNTPCQVFFYLLLFQKKINMGPA